MNIGLKCPKCSKVSFKGPLTKFCQYCGTNYSRATDGKVFRNILIDDQHVSGLAFSYIFADNDLIAQYCGGMWKRGDGRSWIFTPTHRDGILCYGDIEETCAKNSVIRPLLKTICFYDSRPKRDDKYYYTGNINGEKEITYGEILERMGIDEDAKLEEWRNQLASK